MVMVALFIELLTCALVMFCLVVSCAVLWDGPPRRGGHH